MNERKAFSHQVKISPPPILTHVILCTLNSFKKKKAVNLCMAYFPIFTLQCWYFMETFKNESWWVNGDSEENKLGIWSGAASTSVCGSLPLTWSHSASQTAVLSMKWRQLLIHSFLNVLIHLSVIHLFDVSFHLSIQSIPNVPSIPRMRRLFTVTTREYNL